MVFGVTSITGAVLGGVALMLLPVLQASYPSVGGLLFVVIAVGAILLARDPNGLAIYLFRLGRWLERRIAPTDPGQPADAARRGREPRGVRRRAWTQDATSETSTESEGVPAHAH